MNEQPVTTRWFHINEAIAWLFLGALLCWLAWQAWHREALHLFYPIFSCIVGALFVLQAMSSDRPTHVRRAHFKIGSLLLTFSAIVFGQRLWNIDMAASVVYSLGAVCCAGLSLVSLVRVMRHRGPESAN